MPLDTPERQEAMEAIVAECCASGESLVAVAGNGTVVGFVLAKPDRLERFFKKNQALSLRYIGVNKVWRRHGIFSGLMEKSMAKGVPLTASLTHQSKRHGRTSCKGWIRESGIRCQRNAIAISSDASRQNPMMPRNIKDSLSTSTICPFCSLHIDMIRCFGRPLVERLQRLAFLRRC